MCSRSSLPRAALAAALCACLACCRASRADNLPVELAPSDVSRLDADTVPISDAFAGLLVVPHAKRSDSDKYGAPYHLVIGVYAAEHAAGGDRAGAVIGYAERFLVHAPDAQARPLAERVARLLLLCYDEAHRRIRYDHPTDTPSVDVWLTRGRGPGLSPDVGGEQFKDQIYIYDIFAERAAGEWARETCHEYGHFALPGVSGFKSPEEWANGELGQRLFLKWIWQDVHAGTLQQSDVPFVDGAQLDEYADRQILPLLRRIAREGMDPHAIVRTDAAGMDYYTGLALYVDSVYGSNALLQAFAYTSPRSGDAFVKAPDFLRGVLDSLAGAAVIQVRPPWPPGQDRAPRFFAYLPRGEYAVALTGGARAWRVPDGVPGLHQHGAAGLTVSVAGWQPVTLTLAPSSAQDAGIRLTRRGAEIE